MKNQDKFEKEIKAQFDNFEPKPNEGLWDNIAQNIPSDNFEKNIAQKLTTLQFEPSKGIWLAIEKRLPQIVQFNKKLIYIWTLTVLSIGVLAGYFINNYFSNTNSMHLNLTHPKAFVWLDSTVEGSLTLSSGRSVPSNKQLAMNNGQNENSYLQNAIGNNQKIVSKHQNTISKQPNAFSDKPIAKSFQSNAINNDPNTNSKMQNAGSIQQYTNSNEPNASIKQPNTKSNEPNAKSNEPNASNTLPNTSSQLPNTVSQNLEVKNNDTTNNSAQSEVSSQMPNTKQQIATEADYKGATLKKEKLTIIAYAGVGYSYMIYSGDNYKTNIKLRENTEKPEINITGGFVFGYDITKRITLSSGLILSNFKQTLSYNKELAKTPSGNYEENLLFYNDTISIGNNNSSSLNYSFTEIPFFVTYKIFENKKIELALQSGLGIGFLTGINTFIINENNIGIYEISNKNDFPNFRNTVFFSFQPQLNYNLNTPGVSVGIMPIFKTSIVSIVDNENWVKQYPYNLSMNLFLRKRF